MLDPVARGRKLAYWVKNGFHKQGDGYLVGIYFMVSPNLSEVKEGIDLVKWSLDQAIQLRGCGRHIVPTEEIARQQVQVLYKHVKTLSHTLQRIGNTLHGKKITSTGVQGVLQQIFLEELMTPAALECSATFKITERDSNILADYFLLGLGTLKCVLELT